MVALACTHSPDDLNFVLVDFKGGATFLGLEELPHTSAVITNLEEESVLVDRMFDAISGEMNRRQEVLREAGNFANVHDYAQAREADPSMPAMPALFIVVDEFSELLGQHPDFADLFVAVGRLGRSLHIHLLLASQRLEEGRLRGLESHLSYRLGLKTFSAAESRQVLGVPDAHQLPSKPGAGYLKSTADELLRFQCSYVSGPLTVRTAVQGAQLGVSLWQGWDHFLQATEEKSTQSVDPTGRTLVTVAVEAAIQLAARRGQSARKIWLPPLPAELPIAGTVERYGFLEVAVGIIDRPYHQRQDPFCLDFAGHSGHVAVCGGPQTGKTTFLFSAVISLAATHSTSDLRFYILDLAGTGLGPLERLPHVAGVAHRAEEERVRRVLDEVVGLIDAPEARHTFLIIDGWHVLGAEFEDTNELLERIAADGLAARVHLVVSTSRWTSIRPGIRDLIPQRVELKLVEALDSVIDRKKQQALAQRPGIGLTPQGENMLVAIASAQDAAHVVSATASQHPVPRLKVLPAELAYEQLSAPIGTILLGLGGPKMSAISWDLSRSQHLLCIGGQSCGKSTTLSTIARGVVALGRREARIVMIDHRRAHLGEIPEDMLAGYSASSQTTQSLLEDVQVTLKARLPGPEVTPEQLKERSWWSGPEIYLFIDDFDLLGDSALFPLKDLLPHARDIGLRVVVARKSGGVQRALYQQFLSEVKDQSPMVLVMDADKEEGAIFGVRPQHQPPGRCVVVERSVNIGTVQIALPGGKK